MKRMLLILLATVGAIIGQITPARADSSSVETVCLGVRETNLANAPPQPAGILMREIARQAFLIAARDECGLPTRDAGLREVLPSAPGGKPVLFQMLVTTWEASSCEVHVALIKGDQTQRRAIVERSFQVPRTELLVQLVEKCESLSRNEFKDVLGREVHPQKLAAARTAGEPSKPVAEQLAQWNEMAVVGGLRSLHAEILAKGESPETLAALARAYANLGVMTECHWSPAHKAYKARALLYAERLVRQTKGSSEALCHRAYVRALVGLHAAAAADIQHARDQLGKASNGKPLPEWVETIDRFCHGKMAPLIAEAQTEPDRSLYRLLRLLLVENTFDDFGVNEAAQALLDLQPNCFRAFQARYEVLIPSVQRETISAGPSFFLKSVVAPLAAIPGLPAPVREKLAALREGKPPEEQFAAWLATVTALSAAGRQGGDRQEPSLDAVASLIREIQFVLVSKQVEFGSGMGVESSGILTAPRPWVKNHPYGAWVDIFQQQGIARTAAWNILARAEPSELEFTEFRMLDWLNQEDAQRSVDLKPLCVNHSDPIYRDLIIRAKFSPLRLPDGDKKNVETAALLRSVSPWTSPFIAMLISIDGTSMDKAAARLERDYAADPIVLSELANRYLEVKRLDDAERCLERLTRLNPRFHVYWRLAVLYKSKGDMARWKKTLEKSLECPSENPLEHPVVQVALAEYLMQHNELDPALRYAKAAAQSYSDWSLMMLARCYELRQEWDEAEVVLRAVAQRYHEECLEWMFFCARSGHGHADEAEKVGREFVESLRGGISEDNVAQVATFYILVKEPTKALALFQEDAHRTQKPYRALYAALLADSLGQAALRDSLLAKIVNEEKGTTGSARAYVEVASMMRRAVQRENPQPFDLSRIEPLIANTEPGEPTNFYYYVGAFLRNRGDLQNAKKYLMRNATSPLYRKNTQALARVALRELKVPIEPTRSEEIAKP
jgi:tetratricopeptide (TPR) repeat protein